MNVIGLSDGQLSILLEAARPLALEKREIFLQRVDSMLRYRRTAGRGFDDEDVRDVCGLARAGLLQGAGSTVAA